MADPTAIPDTPELRARWGGFAFDAATEAGVAELFRRAGYEPEAATPEQRAAYSAAQEAVTQARLAVLTGEHEVELDARGPAADEVAALLMLADDAGDPRASTVADYRARQDAGLPAVEPVSCRDSAAPVLLLERDAAAEGTVFELPVLFYVGCLVAVVAGAETPALIALGSLAASLLPLPRRERVAAPEPEDPVDTVVGSRA